MITATFKTLRQAERQYPSILKNLRTIEQPPTITITITARTILLASLTNKFKVTPPKP